MTGFLVSLGLAAGLALDTAAVAAARGVGGRSSFLLPWLFGAAHGVMATLGWMIGHQAVSRIATWDHWVAFGLLGLLGARMVIASFRPRDATLPIEGAWELVALTIATSLDAMAAGLAIDSLEISPPFVIALIAGVCVALSTLGLTLGRWLGARAGRAFEAVGGLLLIAVGARILLLHLA